MGHSSRSVCCKLEVWQVYECKDGVHVTRLRSGTADCSLKGRQLQHASCRSWDLQADVMLYPLHCGISKT